MELGRAQREPAADVGEDRCLRCGDGLLARLLVEQGDAGGLGGDLGLAQVGRGELEARERLLGRRAQHRHLRLEVGGLADRLRLEPLGLAHEGPGLLVLVGGLAQQLRRAAVHVVELGGGQDRGAELAGGRREGQRHVAGPRLAVGGADDDRQALAGGGDLGAGGRRALPGRTGAGLDVLEVGLALLQAQGARGQVDRHLGDLVAQRRHQAGGLRDAGLRSGGGLLRAGPLGGLARLLGRSGRLGVGDLGGHRVGDLGVRRVGDLGVRRVGDLGVRRVGDLGVRRVGC